MSRKEAVAVSDKAGGESEPVKSEGYSEFTEAKQGGEGVGCRSKEKRFELQGEATFNGGKSMGQRIISAVTSSPARIHGLTFQMIILTKSRATKDGGKVGGLEKVNEGWRWRGANGGNSLKETRKER